MNEKRLIGWIAVTGMLALLLVRIEHSSAFEWERFWQHARNSDPRRIALGLGIIYACYPLRAVRWAILLRPTKKVTAASLFGAQFMGFTAIVLFGRLGELARPYLVARRVKLPLTSQLAVYAVERMFDVASLALIFSITLAVSPSLNTLEHRDLFRRMGYIGLGIPLGIGVFAWFLRIWGVAFAAVARRVLGLLSQGAGAWAGARILTFRNGLQAISSFNELVSTLAVSLAIWGLIAYAYVEISHSFVTDPVLSSLPFSCCLVLMAANMVGSLAQLPLIGGGSQMATAAAMTMLFRVPIESAIACGILLWLVTNASVIPAGLVWAKLEHVSMKRIATEDEQESQPDGSGEPELNKSI